MLTDSQIHETMRRRRLVLLPALGAATAFVFLWLGCLSYFREPLTSQAVERFGAGAGELLHPALIFLAIGVFLATGMMAERRARRFAVACPACGADVTVQTERLLVTRHCPECDARIVAGGRVRSPAAYDRYVARRSRRFLGKWLWLWPAMGLLAAAWADNDPLAFQCCPQAAWVFPLIGATAGGWTWLRTRDARYLPPTLASLAVLGLGAWMYWTRL